MKTSKKLLIVTILTGMFFTLAGCSEQDATSTVKANSKPWTLPVAKAAMVNK